MPPGANYLEIGIYYGESIARLADHYPDRKIYAVDPFIEDGNTTHHSGVEEHGALTTQREHAFNLAATRPNITIFEQTSRDFYQNLNKYKIMDMRVGAVFIDGNHHYEHVTIDWKLALALLENRSGVVAFDDTGMTDVQQAMREFEQACGDRIVECIDLGRTAAVYKLRAKML
jgi:hypothetical protein